MVAKRAFDLTITLIASPLWLPILACSSLLILLTSGRPVFYRSNRLVKVGEVIKTVKFRTMVKNADKIVNRDTVPVEGVRFLNIAPNSPLYTRAGRLIEGVGLTEIPQLYHVIRGQMSIVGNRPLPTRIMDLLRADYDFADDRFLTPAGLTGPVQLVGRDGLSDLERLKIETKYCRAVSAGYRVRLDLVILIYTVLIVLHVKRPLGYAGVMSLIDRLARPEVSRSHSNTDFLLE